MKQQWKKRLFLIAPCLLFIVIIATVLINGRSNSLTQERINELRTQYPVTNRYPESINARPLSFEEVLNYTETVIIADVVDTLPNYKLDIIDPGTPEAQLREKEQNLGIPTYQPSFTPFEVIVDTIILGEPVPDHINLIYNADFKGMEPDLQPGMKIITAIKQPSKHPEANYFFTRYGTYYIVDDNYVLSAYQEDTANINSLAMRMNGQTVEALIEEIKKLKE